MEIFTYLKNYVSGLSKGQLILIISIAFIITQSLLYNMFGVKIMHDSIRYIIFAEELRAGVWPAGYVNWYAGYCIIIFFAMTLKTGYVSIIILQTVLAFAAVMCLFYLVLQLNSSPVKAFFISLLFATSFQVQVWNVYLLTESLFSSGIMFCIFLLYISKGRGLFLLLIFCLLVTILMRPNGFILLISLLLYVIVSCWYSHRLLAKSLLAMSFLSLVLGIIFLDSNIAAFATFFKTSYLNGEVISGYRGVTLHPTKSLIYDDDLSLNLVYSLISSDVLYFFRLAFSKLFFLIIDVRPYYTISHNLYIVAFLGFVYTLFFRSLYSFAKAHPALFTFIASFIVLNACLIMITYADWDGRFLAPLIGPMLIIAGGAKRTFS